MVIGQKASDVKRQQGNLSRGLQWEREAVLCSGELGAGMKGGPAWCTAAGPERPAGEDRD